MASDRPLVLKAVPIDPSLPGEAQPRHLARRAAQAAALLTALFAVLLLTPGLDNARHALRHADPGWVVAGIALEALSCSSFTIAFRPAFCLRMSWRSAFELSWAELGIGSIVPASGAAGLAFGAWVLRRDGMAPDEIARRSVGFFLLTSLVNFAAVAVVGTLLAIGLVGPDQPLWRTALPAAIAAGAIVAIVVIGRRPEPQRPPPDAGRARRWWAAARASLVGGVRVAGQLVVHPAVLAGCFGYWAFDNAVLWAAFHAVGANVSGPVIVMGYLIGQLGGALPLPGGIGGIDGGLIGTLIVYGAPVGATVAAV